MGLCFTIPEYSKKAKIGQRNGMKGGYLEDTSKNQWFETKTIIFLNYVGADK